MKALKSKTIIAAIIIIIVGGAQAFVDSDLIPAGEWTGYVLMAIGVLQAILRSVTTKPLSEK